MVIRQRGCDKTGIEESQISFIYVSLESSLLYTYEETKRLLRLRGLLTLYRNDYALLCVVSKDTVSETVSVASCIAVQVLPWSGIYTTNIDDKLPSH
jgi:hypothetical protein